MGRVWCVWVFGGGVAFGGSLNGAFCASEASRWLKKKVEKRGSGVGFGAFWVFGWCWAFGWCRIWCV